MYPPDKDPDVMFHQTVDELLLGQMLPNRTGLLLELVALKPIRRGEEILLDYGADWVSSWVKHVESWQAVLDAESYVPSYVQDDVVRKLRTEKELQDNPYPDNLFTSCFYRYLDNQEEAERQNQGGGDVVTFPWKQTRGLFEPRNLRPCSVLQRHEKGDGRNRFGLAMEERIPKGVVHIVTHVPRHAIRFSDKMYTTDQHLENAFRHEIGLPDDVFPESWKDLK
jgi:hypothetical protein